MNGFGAGGRKEAGESGWTVVWKAGELIISGNAAGLLFFFFFNRLFPACLGFLLS